MLEMRTDDMRFTREEAVTLFNHLNTPELSESDVITPDSHTEGWAVGLKMAALSLRHQKNIPEFSASFTSSQRYIMDYLVEEVLQLRCTSISLR